MTPTAESAPNVVTDLDSILTDLIQHGSGKRVISMIRRPSAYRTSFSIDEVDVRFDDGQQAAMILKDVAPTALSSVARNAKPAFLDDPLRELRTYERLLAPYGGGTPHCFGTLADPATDRYWLLLERVPGKELYQIGDVSAWRNVARWLARFHSAHALTDDLRQAARFAHLLVHDDTLLRVWIGRARSFLVHPRAARDHTVATFGHLADQYDRVVERLVALPTSVIHGEFYASNVLLESQDDDQRVCPVDWEMTGLGPSLLDLAALVSGKWSQPNRESIALAYFDALSPEIAARYGPRDDFLIALGYCRLHLAVQWLGWSQRWNPPAEHAQDWLAEALALPQTLGLGSRL